MRRVLLVYGKPLTAVSSFKYLGQTLPSSDDDCLAVEQNLRMAWVKWVWLKKCLGGRERIGERLGGFMWRRYKWCFYLGLRHGY